jgi:hypothetical protein
VPAKRIFLLFHIGRDERKLQLLAADRLANRASVVACRTLQETPMAADLSCGDYGSG